MPLDGANRTDLTGIEFVTIDPPGSMDLDQAMHLERSADGYLVRYAIADVAAFVAAGSAVETEAWRRGQTLYSPDARALLYPASLSEGAASLLPEQMRPAVVFTIELDVEGERRTAQVERAVVRSRARLAYGQATVPLLEHVGRLRRRLARARGAIVLATPAQQVVTDPAAPGGYRLELEPRTPQEDWNAEISLLAGLTAADMMISAGIGLLRVMPPADPYRIDQLRRQAAALHVDWPQGVSFEAFVDGLDPARPRHAVLLRRARAAMGHASYLFFRGAPPPGSLHAGVAAHYAHATAPLRRLQDRYVLDLICGSGNPDRLERLPEAMAEAESRAGRLEGAVVDLMETRLLEHRVGETFAAVPLETDHRGTVIQLRDPPVRTRLHAGPPPPLGRTVHVRLVRADPQSRSLEFRLDAGGDDQSRAASASSR
jgi:exoribonuclease R